MVVIFISGGHGFNFVYASFHLAVLFCKDTAHSLARVLLKFLIVDGIVFSLLSRMTIVLVIFSKCVACLATSYVSACGCFNF